MIFDLIKRCCDPFILLVYFDSSELFSAFINYSAYFFIVFAVPLEDIMLEVVGIEPAMF